MKWRKQLAVILTIALTGNMGVISPLASGSGEDVREVEKIAELSKEVLTQKVSRGTTEEDLKLPKTLKVMLEVPEDDEDEAPAEKASGSNVSRTEKKSSQKKSSWVTKQLQ